METAKIYLGWRRWLWGILGRNLYSQDEGLADPVAAVDVSEEALKLPVKYGTVPAEKCYTDPARLSKKILATFWC